MCSIKNSEFFLGNHFSVLFYFYEIKRNTGKKMRDLKFYNIRVNVFKNGPSKIRARQPLKRLK